MVKFTELPVDILEEITAKVLKRRQKRLRLTCRQINEIIEHQLFEHLRIPECGYTDGHTGSPTAIAILEGLPASRIARHVRNLFLRMALPLHVDIIEKVLVPALSSLRNLQSLAWRLGPNEMAEIMKTLAALPNLTQLTLLLTSTMTLNALYLPTLRNIQQLDFGGTGMRTLLPLLQIDIAKWHHLRQVVLGAEGPANFSLDLLADHLPAIPLTEIRVATEWNINDGSYRHLQGLLTLKAGYLKSGNAWTQLKKLGICVEDIEAPMCPQETFWEYISSYSGLRRLELVLGIQDEILWTKALPRHAETLQHLRVPISMESQLIVLSTLRSLVSLKLYLMSPPVTIVFQALSELHCLVHVELVFQTVLRSNPSLLDYVVDQIIGFSPITLAMLNPCLEIVLQCSDQLRTLHLENLEAGGRKFFLTDSDTVSVTDSPPRRLERGNHSLSRKLLRVFRDLREKSRT
ncbi:hypothetical protein C8J56DRAFT_958400 [Mycena floridula]|nr:hypothetical protein C8J56DRAFT_958400 [Mycena floridula]